MVHLLGNLGQILIGVLRQILSFGEDLSEQSFGIFISRALLGTVWSGKVDPQLGAFFHLLMADHPNPWS